MALAPRKTGNMSPRSSREKIGPHNRNLEVRRIPFVAGPLTESGAHGNPFLTVLVWLVILFCAGVVLDCLLVVLFGWPKP